MLLNRPLLLAVLSMACLTVVVPADGQEPNKPDAAPDAKMVAYHAPESTPYKLKPHLETQYLKAHRAGWNWVVLKVSAKELARSIADDGIGLPLGSSTCCEATRNVTLGWEQGQDDATDFLEKMPKLGRKDRTVIAEYEKLLRDIRENPVKDWFVLDGYDPKETVTENETKGDIRIIRTFRDKTKTKLVEVQRYRGNVLHGDSEQYDANGELQLVVPYVDGLIGGVEKSYSDSGIVLGRTAYVRGKKHGSEIRYQEDGEMMEYREWDHGRMLRRHKGK